MYNSGNTGALSPNRSSIRRPRPRSVPSTPSSRSRTTSGRSSAGPTLQDDIGIIDDGAVIAFVNNLESLPSDEWRARTMALESLVEVIPTTTTPENTDSGGITPWYKSPTALRRLATPIASLLQDARSTVVKHTGQYLILLVERCVACSLPDVPDVCKHLLKDLLPSIMSLHAQTVNIIRSHAFNMMNEIIPMCRFKSGLPVLLERLRKDKSRDVREGCVRYLGLILRHWSGAFVPPNTLSPVSNSQQQQQQQPPTYGYGYLTKDICTHIGNGLARALMDPSQGVRVDAREIFELFRQIYPKIWNDIVKKPDGILSKDVRLRKSILNAALRADAESSLKREVPGHDPESSPAPILSPASKDGDDNASVVSVNSRNSMNSRLSINSRSSNVSWQSHVSKNSMRSGFSRNTTVSSKLPLGGIGMRGPPLRQATNPRYPKGSGAGAGAGADTDTANSTSAAKNEDPSLSAMTPPDRPPLANKLGTTSATTPERNSKKDDTDERNKAATSIQSAFRRKSSLSPQSDNEMESTTTNANANNSNSHKQPNSRSTTSRPPLPLVSPNASSSIPKVIPKAGHSHATTPTPSSDPLSPSSELSFGSMNSSRPYHHDVVDDDNYNGPTSSSSTSQLSSVRTSLDRSFITENRPKNSRKSSILLLQRLKSSSSLDIHSASGTSASAVSSSIHQGHTTDSTSGAAVTVNSPMSTKSDASEHVQIAMELLTAHKEYIDELMENLRLEMDAVKDFETLLANSQQQPQQSNNNSTNAKMPNGNGNAGSSSIHPTEDEVLEYFETVYSFLDKGTENGNKLRCALDKVSHGGGGDGGGESTDLNSEK